MKIYLSGIQNCKDTKFILEIKDKLLSLGCTTIIPQEQELSKLSWSQNINNRMKLINSCDIIYMFPYWHKCDISRIEFKTAINEKKPFCFNIDDVKILINHP